MPITISLEDAQARLKDVIHGLAPGEEIIITEDQKPVAKIIGEQPNGQTKQRPAPGLGKGMITFIAADFDAPLNDMKD